MELKSSIKRYANVSRIDDVTHTDSPQTSRATIGNIAYSFVVLQHVVEKLHFLLNACEPNQNEMTDAQMI